MQGKGTTTIKKALTDAAAKLQPKTIACPADRNLGNLEAELLLAHTLRKDRAWLLAHDDKTLSTPQLERFRGYVSRRKKHEPLAYITGVKEFYGLPIRVTPSVLIPRPASETVVDLVLNIKTISAPTVLDIGTGSGAIAIAVAKHLPKARVIATDISADALRLARGNAKRLSAKNVTYTKSDLLSVPLIRELRKQKRPLIITANLPYLPTSDKKKLEPDVVRYEPHGALFSGKDGNDLIFTFLTQLSESQLKFQAAFLEFDAPQARTLKSRAQHLFPDASVQIHKDLDSKNRVLEIFNT